MALATRASAPIDYINPHATSTPIGDLKEIEAIREVFGAKMPADLRHQVADRPFARRRRRAGGDLFAADDENGFICESANIENLDPAFADMPIVRERKDNVTLGAVLSNSFGFGGTNASLYSSGWKRKPLLSCPAKAGIQYSPGLPNREDRGYWIVRFRGR